MNNIKEFIQLEKEINKIKAKGWIECDKKNPGAAGIKLENLLNKNPGNFEIPDYNNIEIKTKTSLFRKNITLFNATPDSYLFEIKRIYNLYAYPTYKNKNSKKLNVTVYSSKMSYVQNNIYFSIKVVKKEEKVILLVSNNSGKIIDSITSWSFQLIKEKLERKMKYLCYVKADHYYYKDRMYIKYTNDSYYILKDFDTFINLIEKGKISITFKIGVFSSGKRKGQIHDHGTSFSINEDDLELLFNKKVNI